MTSQRRSHTSAVMTSIRQSAWNSRYKAAEKLERPVMVLCRLPAVVEARQRPAEFFPLLVDRVGLAGAVQDVQLALHHLGDRIARGAEVVARVELGGLG